MDPLTYVRFFTHVLGHSGYSHYMGNMLLLLLVGPGLASYCNAFLFNRIFDKYGMTLE